MEEEKYRDLKRGETGAIISIITYIILSIFKVLVGLWSGSEALRVDGLNNGTDIVASLAVLIGLKYAQKPADRNSCFHGCIIYNGCCGGKCCL